jgi:hypothetical protein
MGPITKFRSIIDVQSAGAKAKQGIENPLRATPVFRIESEVPACR